MDSVNILIIDDVDNSKIGESWVIMTDQMFETIMNNINLNYLLILFTLGCFSSLFCLSKNNNNNNNYEKITMRESEPVKIETVKIATPVV